MVFVLDASAFAPYVLHDEDTRLIDEIDRRLLSGDTIVAPALFVHEVANLLVTAVRRGRIGTALARRYLSGLSEWPIVLADRAAHTPAIFELALSQGISAYDASYLDLAIERRCPLATADRALARAASALGVQLVRGSA